MDQFVSMAITLLLVMDPLGNVPLYLTSLRHVEPGRRQRVIVREVLISLAIMVVWLFIGGWLLDAMNITQEAMRVGGGLVLLLIAIRMIFPSPTASMKEDVVGEPFIVPMAVPYFAGPSVLATEAIMMQTADTHVGILVLALCTCWLVASVILLSSGLLQRILGDKVLEALERLMGMILAVLSVQMMLEGALEFFNR
jgi:multiple antibiotic resistance protein